MRLSDMLCKLQSCSANSSQIDVLPSKMSRVAKQKGEFTIREIRI